MPNEPLRLDRGLLREAAFIVIDVQDWPRKTWTRENILPEYVEAGFTLEELNDAQRHLHEVAIPNTARLLDFFRARGVPCIFVHWQGGRVHPALAPREDEPVLPKTERDAFGSSDLERVLDKIGPTVLWMCGGHTKGCLGDTAATALARGYTVICIRDATFDCSYLRWPKGIARVAYHLVCNTDEVLAL